MDNLNELELLKKELNDLRNEFHNNFSLIKDKITLLESRIKDNQEGKEGKEGGRSSATTVTDVALLHPPDREEKNIGDEALLHPLAKEVAKDDGTASSLIQKDDGTAIEEGKEGGRSSATTVTDEALLHPPDREGKNIGDEALLHPPKELHLKKDIAKNIIKEKIEDIALGPFSHFTEFITQTYKHYKKEDKLPIFFMTLFGIILFLFGAGFFLIYSFEYLNASFRILIGVIVSIAFLYSGIYLFKKEEFKEYASALLSVSLILNYLLIYFSSNLYNTISASIGFIFIIINLLLATALALKYETKIVSVIVLFGGSFSPFLLQNTNSSIAFYLSYLLFILISTLFISNKIKWKLLSELTFIVTLSIIEIILFTDIKGLDKFFYILFLHIFVYVFLYFNFFEKNKIKEVFSNKDFGLLITSIILILGNSYYIIDNLDILGGIYFINSLLFIIIAFIPGIIKESVNIKKIKSLMIVIAASFLGFTVPALFGSQLIGILWGVEAVLIIYISFLFDFKDLRKKAYIFFMLALIKVLEFSIVVLISNYSLTQNEFIRIIIDLSSLFILLFILGQIIKKFKNQKIVVTRKKFKQDKKQYIKDWEPYIIDIINELLGFLSATIFTITLLYFLKETALIFSIIPMFGLLYWGIKKNLLLSFYLGYLLFFSLFIPIIISIIHVKSLHFSDQILMGKISLIEIALILFFLQTFLVKFNNDSFLLKIAKLMRTIFLLILPFLIISPTKKYFYNYLMFSLWGSVVINFIIYDITKRKSSKIELFLLINIVSGISFITFLDAYLYFKAPSILLLTGFTLLFALFIAKKGYSKEHYNNPEYKIFFTLLIYYTAFYIFTISIYQTQIKILTFSLINSLLFLSFLIILKNKIHIINNSLTFTYRVIQLGLILYFITLFDQFRQINIYSKISFLESFIILVIFFILLHKNYGFYNLAEKNYNDFKRKLDIIVFNVFIFAFYSLFIIYFIDYDLGISLTIAIIIHGIWTIFTSLNNDFKFLSKLSIFLFILGLAKLFFIDLSNSSLVNKMIVFLVLGVILLLSAFSFQKIKNKLLNKE